jgi:hypothetical protein
MITKEFREELVTAAVLHYLHENNGLDTTSIHWSLELAQATLFRLGGQNLIYIDDYNRWQLTIPGKKAYQKVLAAIDQLKKFEIFAKVYFVELPEDMCQVEGDDILPYVLPQYHDPRFIEKEAVLIDPSQQAEDLRLAMMSYVMSAIENNGKDLPEFSSTRIVFLQKLIDEELTGDFWAALFSGKWILECDDISQSQVRWEDLVEGDDEESLDEAW